MIQKSFFFRLRQAEKSTTQKGKHNENDMKYRWLDCENVYHYNHKITIKIEEH